MSLKANKTVQAHLQDKRTMVSEDGSGSNGPSDQPCRRSARRVS